ncbi:MAG: T9SS type A sorting domain-containing protein [Candidatus Marinimicrobia bacterium]|nr:T9SS type A sorting domain-containing protein [Candidatus Neomarinimicrobiota bacterium]MCF7830216.1 T9SS type A sorting domain-containing protein [Candidatus Neomarinimicrobiota bacterium]MCF7880833.1 T9SS type A sorting domain-containing protein [Candidatus Neomarinimicrobiota bacterium]
MRFLLILFTGVILCPGLINLSFSQSKGGHWQFENNGLDSAVWDGFDNNGSLQGNAIYSNVPPLQQGMDYLSLDTVFTHDYFKVEDSNDLNFTDENIGISAWIYPLVLNDVHFLVNKGRQDSNPKTTNYALRISKSNNLEFLIRDAGNQAQTVASSFTIPVNQWTFVAAYYDYSLGKVFMWNTPSASATDTMDFIQPLIPNSDPLSVGSWYRADPNSPSIKDFEGRMDDVRISGRLEDVVPAVTGISVNQEQASSKEKISLDVFPNPVQLSNSRSNVTIQFKIFQPEEVTVSVYNILGQKIFYAAPGIAAPENRIIWDMKGFNGNLVSSGFYFIHIKTRSVSSIRKILILE